MCRLILVWCATIHNTQVLCWSLISVSFWFHSINMKCSQTKHNNKFPFFSPGFTLIWKETQSLLLSSLCYIMITASQMGTLHVCVYHGNWLWHTLVSATVNAQMRLRCFSVLLTYFIILIRWSTLILLSNYLQCVQKVEMCEWIMMITYTSKVYLGLCCQLMLPHSYGSSFMQSISGIWYPDEFQDILHYSIWLHMEYTYSCLWNHIQHRNVFQGF